MRSSNHSGGLPPSPPVVPYSPTTPPPEADNSVSFADALTIAISVGDVKGVKAQMMRYAEDRRLWTRPSTMSKKLQENTQNPSEPPRAVKLRYAVKGALVRAVGFTATKGVGYVMAKSLLGDDYDPSLANIPPVCCDVNERQPRTGFTALHLAVMQNSLPLVRLLLECDATNVNAIDSDNFTPLQWAVGSGLEHERSRRARDDFEEDSQNDSSTNHKGHAETSTEARKEKIFQLGASATSKSRTCAQPPNYSFRSYSILELLLSSGRCDVDGGVTSPLQLAYHCVNYFACSRLLAHGCSVAFFASSPPVSVPDPLATLGTFVRVTPESRRAINELLEDNGYPPRAGL